MFILFTTTLMVLLFFFFRNISISLTSTLVVFVFFFCRKTLVSFTSFFWKAFLCFFYNIVLTFPYIEKKHVFLYPLKVNFTILVFYLIFFIKIRRNFYVVSNIIRRRVLTKYLHSSKKT